MKYLILPFLLLFSTVKSADIAVKQSNYAQVRITQDGSNRCMVFNSGVSALKQACKDIEDPAKLVLPYTKAMVSALVFKPQPERVLFLGLGGGIIPEVYGNIAPDAFIEVVEIDPVVIEFAKKYFFFAESNKRRIYNADARVFVRKALSKGIKYDMIILDAFNERYIPEHLATQDFYKEIRAIMKPKAILVANTFKNRPTFNHESETFYSVFGQFRQIIDERSKNNRIIIASRTNAEMPSIPEVQSNAKTLARALFQVYDVHVNHYLPKMNDDINWNRNVKILTDQYSPVNVIKENEKKNNFLYILFFGLAVLAFLVAMAIKLKR